LAANPSKARAKFAEWGNVFAEIASHKFCHKLPTTKISCARGIRRKNAPGMKRAKVKTAVPLSAGERYVEFTDSSKQLARARKALGLKENEALLVFTDGEREFAVATGVD
jgi:hypothetical protein